MSFIINLDLVTANTMSELISKVKGMLNDGWQPFEAPFENPDDKSQVCWVIIQYEDEDPEPPMFDDIGASNRPQHIVELPEWFNDPNLDDFYGD